MSRNTFWSILILLKLGTIHDTCAIEYVDHISDLTEARAVDSISINTNYLVFSPTAIREKNLPLLIYLHGAGGG